MLNNVATETCNVTNGIQFSTALLSCGDEAQSLTDFSIHDNYLHGLSAEMSNDFSPYTESQGELTTGVESAGRTSLVRPNVEHNRV